MDHEKIMSPWQEWKIIEKIGEGSYGKVYKAERTEQGHSFFSAIKVIPIPANRGELNSVRLETTDENSTREYFKNIVDECIKEICTMEYFRGNSHIVSVEDFKVVEYLDEIGWDIYIRMEFLGSFLDFCTGRELMERDIIKLGIDLCKALEYCGQLRIIHRDIKPENIFVSRFGDFKLGDFGIARELERSMGSMSRKGTYSYMAPEMYKGEVCDSSVDLYSLGIVLYRLMNKNRLPFINMNKQLITFHDKEAALTRRMSGESLPRPVDASEELSEIILRACAFDVKERYQDPEQMREDLERLRRGEYIAGSPIMTVGRGNLARRNPDAGTTAGDLPAAPPDPVPDVSGNSLSPGASSPAGSKDTPVRQPAHVPVWMLVILLIAVTACIVTGFYAHQLYMDAHQHVSQEHAVVDALETNDRSTAQIDDFSTAIQLIKDQATQIVDLLPSCREEGTPEQRLHYYDEQGRLVKALLYPSVSETGMYEEYYYWDEQLFFCYMWDESSDELWYYDTSGRLIRWIDTDGEAHDMEEDNPDYVQRGARIRETAISELRSHP